MTAVATMREPWEDGPPEGWDDADDTTEPPPSSSTGSRGPLLARLTTAAADWLTTEPAPREYLMRDSRTGRGAIPATGAALLVAAGGAGKSYATVALALSVATHTSWLGFMAPERQGRALILSAEEPADELRRRLYHVARAARIGELPADAIDVIDVHDTHLPLLTPDAEPTDHAAALLELVRARGPYALVVVDPLARVSGASIDADNVAACALVTVLESIATAARGLVLGVHHTSQTARRSGIVDATAIRGATGLGDSARLVLVLTVETIEHADDAIAERLGEIVTLTRAKANHVGRWDPIQARRGEHGVLVPLDTYDREMIAGARQAADPTARRQAVRDERAASRQAREAEAVAAAVRAMPGIVTRDLRTRLSVALHVRATAAAEAIDRAVAEGRVRRETSGRTQRHYPGDT